MVSDRDLVILIIEDEQEVRQRLKELLRPGGYRFVEAENMEKARGILRSHWDRTELIVMDVMLPKDEADSRQLRDLMVQRGSAFDAWLLLEDEARPRDDSEWLRARFAVDWCDKQIFDLLDVEGGIRLIEERVNESGQARLQKPVLYLTARGNQAVRDFGMNLVAHGRWLTKPVTSQEMLSTVSELREKEP